jgi:hypothetical protein
MDGRKFLYVMILILGMSDLMSCMSLSCVEDKAHCVCNGELSDENKPIYELTKLCGLALLFCGGRALVHELGHVISARYLFNAPGDISLFTRQSDVDEGRLPLIDSGRLKIYSIKGIKGFVDPSAYSMIMFPTEGLGTVGYSVKKITVLASGPGAELAYLAFVAIYMKKYAKHPLSKKAVELFLKWARVTTFVSLDPSSNGGDGIAIVKEVGGLAFSGLKRLIKKGEDDSLEA